MKGKVSFVPTEVTNYQCPACTGPLHFSGESGKLECDYCGSSYTVAQIEDMYREKEAKAAAAQNSGEWKKASLTEDWGSDANGMKTYTCPSCGAELICDENTAATCCPYCGNQTVIPGQFAGALKPEYVIPFKTDKAAAIEALKSHYKGKVLLPKSFADNNHVEKIQGVYVPFWMFDAEAKGEMSFQATSSRVHIQGDEEITTTDHFEVYRSGSMEFEKIPVDASSRMPDGHMDAIEPFDYSELKPFSTAYMPGFLADKYDVETEECGKRMEERCSRALADALSDTVTGYDQKSVTNQRFRVQKGDVHYAMLPVWMLATKWNDQSFLFAMNGQSGRLVGDLPVDKKKYWGMFIGIAAVLAALMLLICPSVFDGSMDTFTMIVVCILLPVFIAFVIVSILRSQLKSVHTANAGKYVTDSGLTLLGKTDKFIRTTVTRRKIHREPPKK